MPDATTALMNELAERWDGETTRADVAWDETSRIWEVRLMWLTDRNPPHEADWVEYTWIFPHDNLLDALTEAVEWCRALEVFRLCDGCDGLGWYWTEGKVQAVCEECEGTGLARREEAAQ